MQAPRFRGALLALLILFAALYLLTLDNGLRPGELVGGDLITHQYAQVQGRPSNAPGYPLYTLGGAVWFRLGRLLAGPQANPIAILSSYSTLWALLALGLLFALIREVINHVPGTCGSAWHVTTAIPQNTSWIIPALVTAFYGVTYFFWYYAVTTEQYTSSVAWTLAVFLLAFRWERGGRDGDLLGIAALTGVGLAHQLTLLLAIPPLLWFVLTDGRGKSLLRRPRLVAAAVGVAALPLLSYAYVLAGGALHPEWRGAGQWDSAWQWFWSFVSTQQGRAELTWALRPLFTAEFPSLIWGELTVPGLLGGLIGIAALGRRRAVALYATLALYFAFCWVDRLGNWYQVIMPAYALLALGIAAAAQWLVARSDATWTRMNADERGASEAAASQFAEASSSRARHFSEVPGTSLPRMRHRTLIPAGVFVALVILIAYRAALSYPRANSHNRPDDNGLTPGWAILADDPPAGTAVLGTLGETLALNYLTQIWGARPDLRAVTTEQARGILAEGGVLAATVLALPLVGAEVSPAARTSALGGTLVAVSLAPNKTPPAGLLPGGHDFGGELRLLGSKMRTTPGAAGADLSTSSGLVLLAWQALTLPTQDWSVSVRLTQGGREIAQLDRTHPVFGAYPTTRWAPGEVVADAYPFTLPPGSAPDGMTVILYRRGADGGFVNLDVARLPLTDDR